jgi:hypothetical protein
MTRDKPMLCQNCLIVALNFSDQLLCDTVRSLGQGFSLCLAYSRTGEKIVSDAGPLLRSWKDG